MRQGNVLRFTALVLLSFMLTGCIHYTHKSAEGKPPSEIATIKLVDQSLVIVRIDGELTLYILAKQTEYLLGAGAYRIQVRKDLSVDSSTSAVERDVELVAGHTYGLYGKTSRYWWNYEIRDIETGQRADIIPQAITKSPATAR